jgi:enoyl-CoA hydratase/carnithine racemase
MLRARDGDVEVWTINLPEQRNPITGSETIDALVAAVLSANEDESLRCIILTGAGTAFSSGGNIKDLQAKRGFFGGTPHSQAEGYRKGIQRVPRALAELEVPIVAAVNGPAVGAGCDLALMCDLRVASSTAFFAESFVQLGLIPGDGGAWLLSHALTPARAAEMVLTGDRIAAAQAMEWGIVNCVVEPEHLMSTARALADRVAKNPPLAVRMAKRLLRESKQQSLFSILELSAALQSLAHHTSDHDEAVAASAQRRPGVYRSE